MKRLLLILAMTLTACSVTGTEVENQDGVVKVTKLSTFDGCKLYEFDNGAQEFVVVHCDSGTVSMSHQ